MTWIEWILGIVASITAGALVWVGKVVSGLPINYVPRSQVDARFRDLEARLHNDITSQEARAEKRFDVIDAKLDRIIERMESKADK